MTFALVGKGAAKAVYALVLSAASATVILSNQVLCTPTSFWKRGTLEKEVHTCKQIRDNLASLHISPSHLAISYKESPVRVENQYTLMCDRATGDLEKAIRNPKLSFAQRIGYCRDICLGLTQLHEAQFVHQDIKLDNFLLFGNTVKLSDFGTAKPQQKNTFSFHSPGNARYAPPEHLISPAGELFSSGLVCIRILEEAILLKTGQKMLLPPVKRWYHPPLQFIKETGVIQHLIAHADSSRPSRALLFKYFQRCIAWIRHCLGMKVFIDHPHQRVLHQYIDALSKELSLHRLTSSRQAKRIGVFLKQMTASDPAIRPTAHQAAHFFQKELPLLYRAGIL